MKKYALFAIIAATILYSCMMSEVEAKTNVPVKAMYTIDNSNGNRTITITSKVNGLKINGITVKSGKCSDIKFDASVSLDADEEYEMYSSCIPAKVNTIILNTNRGVINGHVSQY